MIKSFYIKLSLIPLTILIGGISAFGQNSSASQTRSLVFEPLFLNQELHVKGAENMTKINAFSLKNIASSSFNSGDQNSVSSILMTDHTDFENFNYLGPRGWDGARTNLSPAKEEAYDMIQQMRNNAFIPFNAPNYTPSSPNIPTYNPMPTSPAMSTPQQTFFNFTDPY